MHFYYRFKKSEQFQNPYKNANHIDILFLMLSFGLYHANKIIKFNVNKVNYKKYILKY
jgi:hypothetical protein